MTDQEAWNRAHALVNAIKPRKGVGAAVVDNPEEHVMAFERHIRADERARVLREALKLGK
jgi:hypothetical protein